MRPSRVYNLIYPELNEDDINDIAFYFDAEYKDYSERYEAKLLAAIEEWKLRTDAALDVFSYNDSIKIVDARDPKNNRELSFKGLESCIYLLCDKANNIPSLLRAAEITRNVKGKEIKLILDNFIREGLMIESKGRYLSLAVMR